jgi:hypothetical protein
MKDTIQLTHEIRWLDAQDDGKRGGFVLVQTEADARKQYAETVEKLGAAGVYVRLIEEVSGIHVRDVDTSEW